jgi:HSP20 family protein
MALPVRRRDAASQPLQRWDPLRELEGLQQRMGELMASGWPSDAQGPQAWIPLVDVEETDDAWIVEAELPGVRPEDVNVELHDNELSITGEIKERERKGILRRRTRRVGEFDFHILLPGAGTPDDVDAKLSDGILTVRVPKPEHARARRIDVRSEAS